MAVDFAGLLSRKYDIQQQNADAQDRLSWANTGAINQQTALAPAEAAAKNFAMRGSGSQAFAQGRLADTTGQLAPQIAGSEDMLRRAQGNQANASGNLMNTNAALAPGLATSEWLKTMSGLNNPNPGTTDPNGPGYHATGTSMIKGPGTETSDSVPAKLSKGEAVLNAAAAEHLGRSTIDFLNAIGAHKMGMTAQDVADKSSPAKGSKNDSGQKVSNQTGDPPGYADGTSSVTGSFPNVTNNLPLAPGESRTGIQDLSDDMYSRGLATEGPQQGYKWNTGPTPNNASNFTYDVKSGDTPDQAYSKMNHDDRPMHYAWGTDNVQPPGPGQTITSGTWTPGAGAPFNPRTALGMTGVPRPAPPQGTGQAGPKPQGYAKGTSNVKKASPNKDGGTKSKAKGSSAQGDNGSPPGLPPPGVMQALLSMQGGGGMPPPGASPMPMPMPKVAR
jgi:hypothetical protein